MKGASTCVSALDLVTTARGSLLDHAGKCEAGNCIILPNGLRAIDELGARVTDVLDLLDDPAQARRMLTRTEIGRLLDGR